MKGSIKEILKQKVDEIIRSFRSTETVFSDIYRLKKWGGSTNESDFRSGLGSADSQLTKAYIDAIELYGNKMGFSDFTFVDIGCGDFQIGNRLSRLCRNYVGVDIVEPLIKRNQRLYENEKIRFFHLDATRHQLPDGQVCFLRQVFQHLSNNQILIILEKIKKYDYVFITEHLPKDENLVQANLDKIHGADIRVYNNSGVYLNIHPFNIPNDNLTLLLESPGTDLGQFVDRGVIRTYLYQP